MDTSNIPRHGFHLSLNNGTVTAGSDIEQYETPNSQIWLLNPTRFEVEVGRFEQLDNKDHQSWTIPRPWSVLIKDKNSGWFRVANSVGGEFAWYYSPDHPGIISTEVIDVAHQTGLTAPDSATICALMGVGWTVGGHSLVKGIRKIGAGHVVEVGESRFVEQPLDLQAWLGLDDSISDPTEIEKMFIDVTSEGLQGPDSQVSLTSGKDSRAILAAAMATGQPFVTQTGMAAKFTQKDVDIPKRISAALGKDHLVVDLRQTPLPSVELALRTFSLNNNGESDPTNAIVHFKEFVNGEHGPTKLGGWGGEIYFGLPDTYKKILDLKLGGFEAQSVDEVRQRIEQGFTEANDVSERYGTDVFHLREKSVHSGASNIRGMLTYYRTFAPFYDPRVMSLGYRAVGGPQGSKLHSTVYRHLPAEIRNIPVNKGGAVGTFLFKARRRFYPDYNRSLLVDADHMRSTIEPSFFGDVMPEKNITEAIDSYADGNLRSTGTLHKLLGLQYFFNLVRKTA